MFGLDHLIEELGQGRSAIVVLVLAVVLGLRHALDPDHLVAVSTLVAGEPDRPGRRATLLGLSWGLGHATTLFLAGIPAIAVGARLPGGVQRGAEVAVGLVIMALALRLIVRWRAGRFHAHAHSHGGVVHRHLHRHAEGHEHEHRHETEPLRSPLQAFAVGVVHGVAGSAAVVLLLLASIGDTREAVLALFLFALGTAASMAALSAAVGLALARGSVQRRLQRLVPVLGVLSLAFGAWYAAAAVQ